MSTFMENESDRYLGKGLVEECRGDSARVVLNGLGFVYACRGFNEEVRLRDECFQGVSGGRAESSSMDVCVRE